jgi:thioredoxin-like negative regulator of GroEL
MAAHYPPAQSVNVYDISNPEQLTELAKRKPGRIIMRFYRIGCPACDRMAGIWADMTRMMDYKHVTFANVNVEDSEALTKHYTVDRIPFFVCIERGIPKSSFSGADATKLKRMIEIGYP